TTSTSTTTSAGRCLTGCQVRSPSLMLRLLPMPEDAARASSVRPFAGTARFHVLRKLGAGGMGVVYEALDRETDTRVALKTLRTFKPDAILRFKNSEFRALQDIQHPNLASLLELFEENGQLFFTMEMVRGVHFL